MRRIIQLAITRKLIGFLPVLPPALTVALTGEAAIAAERPPRQSQRQAKVDECPDIIGSASLLFGAARGHHHRAVRFAKQACRLYQLPLGHAGNPLDPVWPVRRHNSPHPFEIHSPGFDIVAIDQSALDRDMQQPVRQRRIRSRRQLQMQIRRLRRCRSPRVRHDQLTACGPLRIKILHDGGHGLGWVRPRQQHGFRF